LDDDGPDVPARAGSMRLIAFIQDERMARKILAHLGLLSRARAPPGSAERIDLDGVDPPGLSPLSLCDARLRRFAVERFSSLTANLKYRPSPLGRRSSCAGPRKPKIARLQALSRSAASNCRSPRRRNRPPRPAKPLSPVAPVKQAITWDIGPEEVPSGAPSTVTSICPRTGVASG
jgi:hypothetical protein